MATSVPTSLNRVADSEVELRRVSGVNAPVGSRDPVYNFLCCLAIDLRLVTSVDIMTSLVKKIINIDQNSRSQPAME